MVAGRVGILGGSGFYDMAVLEEAQEVRLRTPFGLPSGPYLVGKLSGREVVFLARHGEGHRLLPTEINYRANIYGMKELGVEWIVSISAVGSYKEELAPGQIVVVDQFLDRTNQGRKMTFFGGGLVAHVSFAQPTCAVLNRVLYDAGSAVGAKIHLGGTYLNMEGPAFSTQAESRIFKSWGVDVVGMTNMAEARLAREAEICFSTMALISDFDAWREGSEAVSVEVVLESLRANSEAAEKVFRRAVGSIPEERNCECARALRNAIQTRPDAISDEARSRLGLLVGKYLDGAA